MSDTIGSLIRDDIALVVPLDGLQLIEASAGTGKTWTIAGLYARWVVERKVELRKLLVMTFTRAATDELRQRLRRRLLMCFELADPNGPHAAWLDAVPEGAEPSPEQWWVLALLRRALAAGEERTALAKRLHLAVLDMDEAVIVTIHSFCQRVLREHAVLVEGASGSAELAPDDGDLLEDLAADAWLRIGAEPDVMQRRALLQLADTPDKLAGMLKDLVSFAGVLEPAKAASTRKRDATETLFSAWAKGGAEAVVVFEQAFAAGNFLKSSFGSGSATALRDLAEQLRQRELPSASLLQRFRASGFAGALKKKAPDFPGHPAFDAIEQWIEALHACIPQLVHRLVAEARQWLVQRKHALARQSYDDQIRLVHDSLCGGPRGQRLRDALRTQYPVALVDEFQDTDARQFAILKTLFDGFGTLFCIGDPKQAIYGFRGGDVHTYLQAGKLAGKQWTLERNFRSSPGVLDACAALFGQNDKGAFVEADIKFKTVHWGGTSPPKALLHDGNPVSPMTSWELPENPVKGGKDVTAKILAKACASEIARLLAPGASTLEGKPLKPGHIAVLVNSNKQAMWVQDALAAFKVSSVCLRRESVYATAEAGELRRLLDALLTPRNARLARGALATHLLGRSLDKLQATQGDDLDWQTELDDLRGRWFGRGVLAMLERLGETHAERLLSQPGGERCLSNLMQLADALQAQARRLSTPQAQRDWLVQRINQADEHNEDEQLRLESDAKRVQILTLHASKGLEYDLVFMPFAALMNARTPGNGELLRFHRGEQLVKRYLVDAKAAANTVEGKAVALAMREDLAEGVRKLYVGVTRARHACWLSSGIPSTKFKDGVLTQVLPKGIAALGQTATDAITVCDLPEPVADPLVVAGEVVPMACRRFERELDRDWWVHSFSRLSDGGHAPLLGTDLSMDAPRSDFADEPAISAGPRGARFGSAVHAVLEQAEFDAWSGAPADLPVEQRQLVANVLRSEGFDTDVAREAALRMVGAALRTPIIDNLALANLPSSQCRPELEFHFGMRGVEPGTLLDLLHAHGYQQHRHAFAHVHGRLAGLMTGLIDLTFVHEGRWWVVDYKTNHLGDHAVDYAPENLPAAIAGNDYDLQYLIYTLALHRWLGQMLGADYAYERDFGGVCYLFLRGMGVGGTDNGIHRDRPPAALIAAMDALLQAPGETA